MREAGEAVGVGFLGDLELEVFGGEAGGGGKEGADGGRELLRIDRGGVLLNRDKIYDKVKDVSKRGKRSQTEINEEEKGRGQPTR